MHGRQSRVQVQCLGTSVGSGATVVGLSWYHGQHGHVEPDCPVLAICYDNGRMQLMRNEGDDSESTAALFLMKFLTLERIACYSPWKGAITSLHVLLAKVKYIIDSCDNRRMKNS
jgi:hypothetical protein